MSGSGGFTVAPNAKGGNGARFDIQVRRLLLAGLIDTAAAAPKGAQAGAGGPIDLVAYDESFFSGTVRGGATTVELPVCCHN